MFEEAALAGRFIEISEDQVWTQKDWTKSLIKASESAAIRYEQSLARFGATYSSSNQNSRLASFSHNSKIS